MKRISVVSLNFSPGNLSQFRALQCLFSELGHEVKIVLNQKYITLDPSIPGIKYINGYREVFKDKPDLILVQTISVKNILLMIHAKLVGVKSYYVLHEPWAGLRKLKNTRKFYELAGCIVNTAICLLCHRVILVSQEGLDNYEHYMKWCNRNYVKFSLLFCDEAAGSTDYEKKYLSFLSSFSELHGRQEYLDFIEYATANKLDIDFLIATRSSTNGYLDSPIIQSAIASGRLTVHSGKAMTSDEVNQYYQQSLCVWNVYKLSTQSGVLPHSQMFGVPAITSRQGAAKEVVEDKKNGCFIELPVNNEDILAAYRYICEHREEMSRAARETFMEKYHYSAYKEQAAKIFELRTESGERAW